MLADSAIADSFLNQTLDIEVEFGDFFANFYNNVPNG